MPDNLLLFNLSEKIEYSKGGEFYETATLELIGPGMPVFDLASKLSQLVMRAVLDAKDLSQKFGDDAQEQSANEIDGATIKMILLSSKSVEFSKVAEVCREIFVRVGTYDGKEKLKTSMFQKLSIEDFMNMICEYIANFTWPSLFSAGESQGTTGNI